MIRWPLQDTKLHILNLGLFVVCWYNVAIILPLLYRSPRVTREITATLIKSLICCFSHSKHHPVNMNLMIWILVKFQLLSRYQSICRSFRYSCPILWTPRIATVVLSQIISFDRQLVVRKRRNDLAWSNILLTPLILESVTYKYGINIYVGGVK